MQRTGVHLVAALLLAGSAAACEEGRDSLGPGDGGIDGVDAAADDDDGDAPPDDSSMDPEPEEPADAEEPDAGPGRTIFDFTVAADRSLFAEQDLEYWTSVGPYALYEVTGPAPRLDGPSFPFAREDTYVMLCAAARYFTDTGAGSGSVTLQLYGGASGDELLRQMNTAPTVPDGNCSGPSDQYGKSTPSAAEISGERPLERLSIVLDPPPAMGSVVLLRRAGFLEDDPGHNESHVIPGVCCETRDQCGIET